MDLKTPFCIGEKFFNLTNFPPQYNTFKSPPHEYVNKEIKFIGINSLSVMKIVV